MTEPCNDYQYVIVPAGLIDKDMVEQSKNRSEKDGKILPAEVSDVRRSVDAPVQGIMTFAPGHIPPPLGSLKRYDSETILTEIAKDPGHWEEDI